MQSSGVRISGSGPMLLSRVRCGGPSSDDDSAISLSFNLPDNDVDDEVFGSEEGSGEVKSLSTLRIQHQHSGRINAGKGSLKLNQFKLDCYPRQQIVPLSPMTADAQESESVHNNVFFKSVEILKTSRPKYKRSSSLKLRITPPETPSSRSRRIKAVRFADVLGLDLETVRQVLNQDEPPVVPDSALVDLDLRAVAEAGAKAPRRFSLVKNIAMAMSDGDFLQARSVSPDFLRRVIESRVLLESCSSGNENLTLLGFVRVAAVTREPGELIVRYTVNEWSTFDEVVGDHVANSSDGATDRFSFLLRAPLYFEAGCGRVQFAIRYTTSGGQEYWDNNCGQNYESICVSTTQERAPGNDNACDGERPGATEVTEEEEDFYQCDSPTEDDIEKDNNENDEELDDDCGWKSQTLFKLC